jgi:DNA-binding XRE family transcriptional regulator
MFNRQQFAEDLFMFRNSKGISRASAAKEIGLNSATMQGLEGGIYNPQLANYRKVCKWLGKDMEYYFIKD